MQRALCALTLIAPEKLPETLDAVYKAFWVERKTIQKPATLTPILEEVLGEKLAKDVMEKVRSSDW